MRYRLFGLAICLTACSGAQPKPPEPPEPNSAAVSESPESQPGRPVHLVEVEPELQLEESGGFEVGDDMVVILEGGDAVSYYAGVRVNEEPPHWLNLYTAEERSAGASPPSGWGWVHMELAPDGQTIVGVLDWFVESGGPTLYVVTSGDSGRSWSLRAEIEKPHHMAIFHELVLYPDEWELTIRLQDCGGCGSLPGDTTWASPPGGDDWRRIAEPTMPDRPSP